METERYKYLQDWFSSLDISWKKIFKKSIDINHNPDEYELEEIINLYEIDCSKTNIISLEPLQYLKKLEKLICSKTKISSIDKIRDLKKIIYLDINNTNVSNLEPLQSLPNLRHLDCSSTKINSLNGLEFSYELEYLSCKSTQILDIIPIKSCEKLWILDISQTNINSISPIKDNLNIKHFYYEDTPNLSNHEIFEYLKKINPEKFEVKKNKPIESTIEPSKAENIEDKINYVEYSQIDNTYNDLPSNLSEQSSIDTNDFTEDYYLNEPIRKKDVPKKNNLSYLLIILIGIPVICLIFYLTSNTEKKEIIEQPKTEIKVIQGIVKTIPGLNLRISPNSNATVIKTISNNEKLKIIDTNGPKETIYGVTSNWYKVEYNSSIGWAWGGFITLN